MRLTQERSDRDREQRMILVITDDDMEDAIFDPHELRLLRGLQEQQATDPTVEGALMIAQMVARAIERRKNAG